MKKILKVLLLGILAGASIGLGGLLYTICVANNLSLLGSFCFGIGLLLVCTLGLYLYTGKIGFILSAESKKEEALNLLFGYLGNIIGAAGFGYLMFAFFQGNTSIMDAITGIASKRSMPFGDGFGPIFKEIISGFCCGILVFLAVYCFKKDWNIILRVFILLFCVFAFVAAGFEHCIANMFYISMANFWGPQTLCNVLLITVANSMGSLLISLAAIFSVKEK